MATYRYLFADALTGQILEELPLDCQSYSQQINGVGNLTGTLALGDAPFIDRDTRQVLINWRTVVALGRTTLVVQRDDRYVWGGWINKLRPTNGGNVAEIGAVTLEGWLAEQEIQTDLTYTGVDVFDIVRGILSVIQGVSGGNMRIGTDSDLSGQVATVTYLGKDSTKVIDAFNRLAEVAPGFEYTITWSRSGNILTPKLLLAAPGFGSSLDPIVLEYPGSLTDYGYEETVAPNSLTGVGADPGTGTPLLARVADTTGQIAAGYPTVYGQAQFKDETDQARLTARTTTALQAGLVDNVVPTAELRPDSGDPGDISIADLTLGQPVRLRVTSLYHPAGVNGRPGLDDLRRITGWTVVPKATEKVSLNLGSTTGKIMVPLRNRTTAAYLADLDRRVRELATRT